MAQYEYADNSGNIKKIEAASTQDALKQSGSSGVRLVSSSPGTTISSANTKPVAPINTTQPAVAANSAILNSDIVTKGQQDTARAVAEEAAIAARQGSKAPTATSDVVKNILGQNSAPTATPATDTTTTPSGNAPINVNGITADTLGTDRANITSMLTNSKGEAGLTDENYAATVDPAQKELSAINQQVNEESLAGRRRLEAVLLIPGITKEQAQGKIDEISRVNTSKLADLSIIQMAKQGQYDSAKAIADRKVQAQLETQKNNLAALQFTYQENKELFTKAEQRQFEQSQADRERKLNNEEKTLTKISDLAINALQNGAPTSVVQKMQNAKTVESAVSLGGQYVDKLDREAKIASIAASKASIANIYSQINERDAEHKALSLGGLDPATTKAVSNSAEYKTISGLLPALNAIKTYQAAVKDSGSYELWNGTKKGELQSSYGNAIAAWKTLAGLGALSGADFGLAENVIPAPGLFQRNSTVDSQLTSAMNNAINTSSALTTRLGQLYPKANTLLNTQLSEIKTSAIGSTLSNQDFLNTIPGSGTSGTTSAISNSSFFNKK